MNKILFILLSITYISTSQGYYSVLDTGDILKEHHYRATIEPQVILSGDTGINFIGRLDTSINKDSELSTLIGGGTTDFHTGVYYKFVPFPDYENQPAVTLKAGFEYGRIDNQSVFTLRLAPITSKKFTTEYADLNAYASIPIGLGKKGDSSLLPIQIVGGAEIDLPQLEFINFTTEIGLNLNDSFSYISFAAILYMDEENGIQFR